MNYEYTKTILSNTWIILNFLTKILLTAVIEHDVVNAVRIYYVSERKICLWL